MKTKRKDEIVRMLTEDRVVRALDLATQFDVSMETIRRDLAELEQEGVARRVHGGATLNVGYSVEPEFNGRQRKNYTEKRLIGEKALSLIKDGDTIILDIGTTVMELTRALKGTRKVTVLTNSLPIAMFLLDDPAITVLVLGGEARHGEGTTSGFWAEEMVDGFQADQLFLGVGALTAEDGVMDYDIAESNLRRHFVRHSKRVVALADYSKFGIRARNVICPADRLDCLVTDARADPKVVKDLRSAGVEVLIAT